MKAGHPKRNHQRNSLRQSTEGAPVVATSACSSAFRRIWMKTTGTQHTPARRYSAYVAISQGSFHRNPECTMSQKPVTGCRMTAGSVKRKSARTVVRAAKYRAAAAVSPPARKKKNAIPRPVPNRTVEVRICSVLMAR
jgi:hypothetical protein